MLIAVGDGLLRFQPYSGLKLDSLVSGPPRLRQDLVPLPGEVIYALSFGVAVRLIAAGVQLKSEELGLLVDATWRAVTTLSP